MCDTDIFTANLGQDYKQTHASSEAVSTPHVMQGWCGPKDQQNKAENFASINCKGEAPLQEHILRDIVPCGFKVIIAEF